MPWRCQTIWYIYLESSRTKKNFPVKVQNCENFLSQYKISCHRKKFPDKGKIFLSLEVISQCISCPLFLLLYSLSFKSLTQSPYMPWVRHLSPLYVLMQYFNQKCPKWHKSGLIVKFWIPLSRGWKNLSRKWKIVSHPALTSPACFVNCDICFQKTSSCGPREKYRGE